MGYFQSQLVLTKSESSQGQCSSRVLCENHEQHLRSKLHHLKFEIKQLINKFINCQDNLQLSIKH